MGAALRVAIGAFLFDPHRRGKNEIGGHRRHGRIGVRDDDEVGRIPVARIGLAGGVRRRLQVVVHLDPVEVQLAVVQHPVLFDRVIAGLFRNDAVRDAPDFLGVLAVLRIGDDHVGGQAMREGADLARGAAGGRLPGQRERRIAGLGDLSRQQMQIVEELVGPYAAHMLVEAHGPERHHLALRIGIEFGELLQEAAFDARELGDLLERVVLHKGGIGVEVDRLRRAGRRRALGFDLERMIRRAIRSRCRPCPSRRWCGS